MDVSLWEGMATRVLGHPKSPAPPPIKATFEGNPEKLAFFLNQVVSHLDQHGAAYADNEARMDTIMDNLDREVAEWLMALHNGAPKLGDPDAFLG